MFARKVQSTSEYEVTCKIKYELLFKHCNYCGLMTHEESYCSKKLEETKSQLAKTDLFSRVQLPQHNITRQTLLSDHNGRLQHHDRYDKRYNDQSSQLNHGEAIPFNPHNVQTIVGTFEMIDMAH